MRPVSISVVTDDPLLEEALTAYLRSVDGIGCVSSDTPRVAGLLIVLVHTVTDDTIRWMKRATQDAESSAPRILLVTDHLTQAQLARAVRYGLAGVLSRSQATLTKIVESAFILADGDAGFPGSVPPLLIEQLRRSVGDGSELSRAKGERLEEREVEVLRLLAEGLDTAEAAIRLQCSERTVKNVLRRIVQRHGLRNRVHAVSYAFQVGAL